MAKIQKDAIDDLNVVVTISIDKSDYEGAYTKQLNKYRKQADLKGFRKGKAPLSFIRKIYGRQLLADEVNQVLQQQIGEALKDIEIFGQPIPNEAQGEVDFNPNKLEDYEFKFDLGLIPEFDLKGVNKKNKYNSYAVKISDETLNKEMDTARRRAGEQAEVDGELQEMDLVKVKAQELDGKKIKEGGNEAEFSFLIDDKLADEKFKKQVLKKKKGDSIDINPFKLEKDADEKNVRKFMLGLEEDQETGETYRCEIIEVTRIQPAEINQEFFDNAFGPGKITSEDEARDFFKETIEKYYQGSIDAILYRDVRDKLIDKNDFPVPENFLKRWIKFSNEQPIADEALEAEFPFFLKDLKWSVIRGKLLRQFDVKVTEDDLRAGFAKDLAQYYGGMQPGMEEIFKSVIDRMLSDEKAVQEKADRIADEKLLTEFTGAVKMDLKEVSEDELTEIIKDANERINKENEERRAQLEPETEEAEA